MVVDSAAVVLLVIIMASTVVVVSAAVVVPVAVMYSDRVIEVGAVVDSSIVDGVSDIMSVVVLV